MARALALLLLAAAPVAADESIPERRDAPARAVVVAELIEAGPRVPHCGHMHFVVPMRFRILSDETGSVPKELWVAVSCPELHRVRFVAGERHRLVLARKKPWSTGALVPLPGGKVAKPLLWAVEVSAAP